MKSWFKIMAIYPLTPDFNSEEELTEIQKIQLKSDGIVDGFETDYAYLDLKKDPIIQLNPKCFVPPIKDEDKRKNRKYYTEIILKSGTVIYAVGKPEKVYEDLTAYLKEAELE